MNFYCNGNFVELLIEDYMPLHGVVYDLVKARDGYEVLTTKGSLQRIATDVYEIGDAIKLREGDYIGVVTGFELETNSVVTKPFGIIPPQIRHHRYVHNVGLVEPYNVQRPGFKAGKFYRFNDKIKAMAIVDNSGKFYFVNKFGNIIYANIHKYATMQELSVIGIHSVKQIDAGEWNK